MDVVIRPNGLYVVFTSKEWMSSSVQMICPLSRWETERQSPKRSESPAIKRTDWPQAMSLQRLQKWEKNEWTGSESSSKSESERGESHLQCLCSGCKKLCFKSVKLSMGNVLPNKLVLSIFWLWCFCEMRVLAPLTVEVEHLSTCAILAVPSALEILKYCFLLLLLLLLEEHQNVKTLISIWWVLE